MTTPTTPTTPATSNTPAAASAPTAVAAPVTLVASDLDRTLIYSAAALQLAMPDAEAPGCSAWRCTTTSRSPT